MHSIFFFPFFFRYHQAWEINCWICNRSDKKQEDNQCQQDRSARRTSCKAHCSSQEDKGVADQRETSQSQKTYRYSFFIHLSMRTGNPPDELEVLVVFRVFRAGYRVVLLRLVLASFQALVCMELNILRTVKFFRNAARTMMTEIRKASPTGIFIPNIG